MIMQVNSASFLDYIRQKYLSSRAILKKSDCKTEGGGGFLGTKKMGRPTDNPKPYKMSVKYDEKYEQILEAYCEQENVNKMQAARRGIMKLEADLKQ